MSRRFSVKVFNIANLNVKLKFESEQLGEDGLVLSKDLFEEVTKVLNEVLPTVKDQSPEAVTETVYTGVASHLHVDPTNVYENMMGDKHQRTKLVSVELFDADGNSAIYGD